MTANCPHCGGDLTVSPMANNELERRLGDRAAAERMRAEALEIAGDWATVLHYGDRWFIAWRGRVWGRCSIRKAQRCEVTQDEIPRGAMAWRPLTDDAGREWRVSVAAWANLG